MTPKDEALRKGIEALEEVSQLLDMVLGVSGGYPPGANGPAVKARAALSLMRAASGAPGQEPSDDAILEIAHRTSSRYTHRSDPNEHSYGFVRHTLLNFARRVLAATPIASPTPAPAVDGSEGVKTCDGGQQ